jgi:hypothetical protein
MTAVVEVPKKKRFTAVDLVTIAALAAIFRSLIYLIDVVGFLWPFNTLFLVFGFGLTNIVAAMVVRKPWVFTLFAVVAQLINLFLQGEMFVAILPLLLWGIFGDLYVLSRQNAGANPFSNLRDMMITSLILGVTWVVMTYAIDYPFIYKVDLAFSIYIILMIVGTICCVIGGYLGYLLGDRIKGLIG